MALPAEILANGIRITINNYNKENVYKSLAFQSLIFYSNSVIIVYKSAQAKVHYNSRFPNTLGIFEYIQG